MTTTTPTDPTALQTVAHLDRVFLTTLRDQQPPFTLESLTQTLQHETAFWTAQVTHLLTGPAGWQALEQVRDVFDAFKHERDALSQLAPALEAHRCGEWAEASHLYRRVLTDLHFALMDWEFALDTIGEDTPFDAAWGTKTEREQEQIAEPSRISYSELLAISPLLFRVYRNMDRVCCLSLELTQRLMLCLSQFMEEAEAREQTTMELPEREANEQVH